MPEFLVPSIDRVLTLVPLAGIVETATSAAEGSSVHVIAMLVASAGCCMAHRLNAIIVGLYGSHGLTGRTYCSRRMLPGVAYCLAYCLSLVLTLI